MADYDLGTARGKILVTTDAAGVQAGTKAVQESEKSINTAAASMKRGMVMASAAIVAGIGVAVHSAVEFNDKLSAVSAQTGLTGSALDALGRKALSMGANSEFSAAQMLDAFSVMVKGGIPIKNVMNGAADSIVALATATGSDLNTAASVATRTMKLFGLGVKDLPKVVNTLAGAASSANMDLGQLALALNMVAPQAHLAGMSMDETATSIAMMVRGGLNATAAGTAMKTMFQKLQPVTKAQSKLFEELGLANKDGSSRFFDATGKMKSMHDIIGLLSESMKGYTKDQQSAILGMVFGTRAIRGISVLLSEGTKGYDAMAGKVKSLSAEERKELKEKDNAKIAGEKLKNSINSLSITVGQQFVPMLALAINKITAVINWFNNMDASTRKTVLTIIAWTAGTLLALAAIGKVVGWIRTFIDVMKALKIVQGIATAAQWLFNGAMAANPVALIILAVIALIAVFVLLWRNNEGFRNFVIAAWGKIKEVIGNVVQWFINSAWPWLKNAFENIKKAAGVVWEFMQKAWSGIKDAVGTAINFVINVLKTVIPIIISVGQNIWNWLVKAFNVVAPIVVSVGTTIFNVFKTIGEVIFTVVSVIYEIWKGVWGLILAVVLPVLGVLVGWFKLYFGFIWSVVSTVVNAVWTVIKTVWDFISPYVSAVFGFVWGIISKVFTWIKNHIVAQVSAAWQVIKAVWDFISPYVSRVFGGIWDFIKTAFSNIKTIVGGAIQIVKDHFEEFKALPGKVSEWFSNVKKNMSTKLDEAVTWVKGIPQKIIDGLGKVGELLKDAGTKIIQGLWDGLTEKWKEASKWISSLGDWIKEHKGPLSYDVKLLVPNGAAIMKGLMDGMQSQMAPLRANLALVSSTIPTAIGTGRSGMGVVGSTVNNSSTANTVVFNNYNNKAETASDANARQLRTARTVGMFG